MVYGRKRVCVAEANVARLGQIVFYKPVFRRAARIVFCVLHIQKITRRDVFQVYAVFALDNIQHSPRNRVYVFYRLRSSRTSR